MMEGLRLCKALWSGEPVDWDGRWQVAQGVLAPVPFRAGGPPLWIGGNLQASLERAGKHFDGWFPIAPAPDLFATQWADIKQAARDAGRAAENMTGAMYLTVALDDDAAAAEAHLREKYAFVAASGRIGTAADFIAKVATRSSLSGQAYEVSCNGGAGVPSGQWLTEALDHHREVNAKPGTRLERARPDDDGPPSAVRM